MEKTSTAIRKRRPSATIAPFMKEHSLSPKGGTFQALRAWRCV
jgi:hypothetical protein